MLVFKGLCVLVPSSVNRSDLVRSLQERAARAFPAEDVREVDGWWLRHAPRYGWWVGTVLPHGEVAPGTLLRRAVAAEEFYADRDTAACFQISPGAYPQGLDTVLSERGYRRHSVMSLQVAPTARVLERAPAGSLRIRWDDRPTYAWCETWQAVHGYGGDFGGEWEMLNRVQPPTAYACAVIGSEVLAVGRAVADTGWAGVFGMATLPEARGKGIAGNVLAALAGWAGACGAERMYLQVERDNVPALRLYERMGFSEVCAYHYRVAR